MYILLELRQMYLGNAAMEKKRGGKKCRGCTYAEGFDAFVIRDDIGVGIDAMLAIRAPLECHVEHHGTASRHRKSSNLALHPRVDVGFRWKFLSGQTTETKIGTTPATDFFLWRVSYALIQQRFISKSRSV